MPESIKEENMSTLLNIRNLGILLILEVVLFAALLMFASTSKVEAVTCTGQYWSAVEDATADDYYGAYGASRIQDASVTGSENHFFVNSTWVQYDEGNWVEVGWIWRGGWSSPKEMAVWSNRGRWYVKYYDTLTTGASQSFEVRRASSSSRKWKWYAGGDLKKSLTLLMRNGIAGAQQERYYACDNPDESHWWNLKRMATIGTRSSWGDMVIFLEDDPDYCINEISNTEFKVQKGSGSSC